MELTNEFEVPVAIDEAWHVLTDLERIAPCMPGAQLKEIEGDEYRGVVKVKVGPITASYKGAARIEKLDPEAHRAVVIAEGRETRGQGNATATITAEMSEPDPGRTKVSVATELTVTGRVAQFGRGVLADVSAKLLDEFATNLESTVLSPSASAGEDPGASDGEPSSAEGQDGSAGGPGPASEGRPAGTAGSEDEGDTAPSAPEGVRRVEHPPPVPIDLVDAAGTSLVRRLAPYASIAGAIFLLRIVVYALRRRKK